MAIFQKDSPIAGDATIIQMVAWGTRLSLGLYEVGSTVPSATSDAYRLAKGVNLLSLVLRQVGACLKEYGTIPSYDAFEDVKQIIQQCRTVFTEIETVVPVGELQENGEKALTAGENWMKPEFTESKIEYLLSHLEAIKLTVNVMTQTFYTVKVIAWSKQHRTTSSFEAFEIERLQLQSLVIEQQMSLIRLRFLYRDYKYDCLHMLLEDENTSHAAGGFEERSPRPLDLAQYQENSLAHVDPDSSDSQQLSTVRTVSSKYIDRLLTRWTRLTEIERHLQQAEWESQAKNRKEQHERRMSQQPKVEDDSSEDDHLKIKQPRPRSIGPGPLLRPADEEVDESNMPTPKPLENHSPPGPYNRAPSRARHSAMNSAKRLNQSSAQNPASLSMSSLPTLNSAQDKSPTLNFPDASTMNLHIPNRQRSNSASTGRSHSKSVGSPAPSNHPISQNHNGSNLDLSKSRPYTNLHNQSTANITNIHPQSAASASTTNLTSPRHQAMNASTSNLSSPRQQPRLGKNKLSPSQLPTNSPANFSSTNLSAPRPGSSMSNNTNISPKHIPQNASSTNVNNMSNLNLSLPANPNSSTTSLSPQSAAQHSLKSNISSMSSSSPRVSFNSVNFEPIPEASATEIPWRLRLQNYWWDYRDDKVTLSNTHQLQPSQVNTNGGTTEILASWVSKEAIEESGFGYTRAQKDIGGGRKTKLAPMFVIQVALGYPEIERLVERTADLAEAARQTRASKRRDSASSNQTLQGTNRNYHSDPEYRGFRSSDYISGMKSGSNNRGSSLDLNRYEEDSSGREGRDGRGRGQSSRGREGGESGSRDRERRRQSYGGGRSVISKLAAGAGVATLLDGFVDGLSAL
ncbi:hypothetical protein K402DRAFT_46268 [Aulographum hederae CBS 113979]|uniref:Fungal N-terminal domain-containing protein n=1 Tax=Aulographum hederae CBS 113979 TaxID=1176131 RepID=A0A6G1H3K9_9PEZI|nr:hypothetical protein K402DRAFT_46268 [Aulographum hederae CBS 113979]